MPTRLGQSCVNPLPTDNGRAIRKVRARFVELCQKMGLLVERCCARLEQSAAR